VHPTAEAQLFFVETCKIMLRRVLHGVVVGKIGLQHDLSGSLTTPRSSFHLGQQLKRALGRAKIRKTECHVGANHADQCHTVNVVALGDHLRTHQQIEFAFVESVEGAFEVFAAAHRVAIKTPDARLGKHSVQ
jgi:hypothetical protein